MLHPVPKDYFFNHVFQRKALIVRASERNKLARLQGIIDHQMFGLDLKSMLANTASDLLHIWHPPKGSSRAKKMTIQNVDTDDVNEAVKAYKDGASLYFGSSLEFRT